MTIHKIVLESDKDNKLIMKILNLKGHIQKLAKKMIVKKE